MNAYLEEELYDLGTYCIQNPPAFDFESKKQRGREVGEELYTDGGLDAIKNIFNPLELRIKEGLSIDVKPYRSWWNHITEEWKY